jgi:hypothetical protein
MKFARNFFGAVFCPVSIKRYVIAAGAAAPATFSHLHIFTSACVSPISHISTLVTLAH